MLLQRFQTCTTRSIASVGELAECYDLMHFALLLFGLSCSLIHSLFPCQFLEWFDFGYHSHSDSDFDNNRCFLFSSLNEVLLKSLHSVYACDLGHMDSSLERTKYKTTSALRLIRQNQSK